LRVYVILGISTYEPPPLRISGEDGIWRKRYIGMLLVEEDSYNCNDRIFWDGWKSINYLKRMDLARCTCGELDVRCGS